MGVGMIQGLMRRLYRRLPPTPAQLRLLRTMAAGHVLKVHRTLDGVKTYRLHRLDGGEETVSARVVRGLERRGLIESNMKFPAATFLLTERGRRVAVGPAGDRGPVGPRGFNDA